MTSSPYINFLISNTQLVAIFGVTAVLWLAVWLCSYALQRGSLYRNVLLQVVWIGCVLLAGWLGMAVFHRAFFARVSFTAAVLGFMNILVFEALRRSEATAAIRSFVDPALPCSDHIKCKKLYDQQGLKQSFLGRIKHLFGGFVWPLPQAFAFYLLAMALCWLWSHGQFLGFIVFFVMFGHLSSVTEHLPRHKRLVKFLWSHFYIPTFGIMLSASCIFWQVFYGVNAPVLFSVGLVACVLGVFYPYVRFWLEVYAVHYRIVYSDPLSGRGAVGAEPSAPSFGDNVKNVGMVDLLSKRAISWRHHALLSLAFGVLVLFLACMPGLEADTLIVAIKLFFLLILTILCRLLIGEGMARYVASRQINHLILDHNKLVTITSFMRMLLRLILYASSFIIFLSIMGISVAPIFANVGILGAGLALSAQSLIKDYVTGFIMALESAFNIGDKIRIDDCYGVIERVTLRALYIRNDNDGALVMVPFGAVSKIANYSRSVGYVELNISLPLECSFEQSARYTEEAYQLVKKDHKHRPYIIGPIEIKGLADVTSYSCVLQARVSTKAGYQAQIRRAFNQALKQIFDRENLRIPVPKHVISDSIGPRITSSKV